MGYVGDRVSAVYSCIHIMEASANSHDGRRSADRREPIEHVFDASTTATLRSALRELVDYREVVWSFTVRSVRVRYKQAVFGVAWAVLQPLALLTLFIVFFGHVVKVDTGGVPYAAFAISALVPWQFVSTGVAYGANALVADGHLMRKAYFPREAPVLGGLASYIPDLGVGLVLLIATASLTGARIGWEIAYLPVLVVALILPAVAIALPLAALTVYFRDFRFALPLAIQLWLFASPVAYPLTRIPSNWRGFYAAANPVVGTLEGFRRVIAVGVAPDWRLLGYGTLTSSLLLLFGYRLFKRLEREFADVV